MNPLRAVLLFLLVLGFALIFIPQFQTTVLFAVATFVILVLALIKKLDV